MLDDSCIWIDYSHAVEGRDMAIGRDRLVTIERGASVTRVPLEPNGAPVLLPRNASKEKHDRQRPALTKVYRPFTGVAMTPDRIVLTMPRVSQGSKPPAIWLMAADGAVLAEAELPADPLPGGLAIAGTRIVVVTTDGGIHRVSTKE
jgi:hypothetical protein